MKIRQDTPDQPGGPCLRSSNCALFGDHAGECRLQYGDTPAVHMPDCCLHPSHEGACY